MEQGPSAAIQPSSAGEPLSAVAVPGAYDYAGVYLTNRCHLSCSYCITQHNDSQFLFSREGGPNLTVDQWVRGLNRLRLPPGIPVTFQGGEPFVYKGILDVIDRIEHPVDILTALPPHVTADSFRAMKRPEALRREAPYPNVRVSYHPGQNVLEDLISRVSEIQRVVRIGIYMVAHPAYPEKLEQAAARCREAGVFFKPKEFLGFHEGKLFGTYRYPDAAVGRVTRPRVWCRNSVLIIHPSGTIFHCHSDLYHRRFHLAVGHVLEPGLTIPTSHRPCSSFGLCSECDVKVKTDHTQTFGYTSADIQLERPADDRQAAARRLAVVS